jgi:uncharacterized protein YndB with AHSA1/START domain
MNVRIDDHHDVSQDELWAAIIDPARLSEWLGGACSIEPWVGGAVRFDLPADGVSATGEVRQFEPPRPDRRVALVSHTWVDGGVTSVCTWSVVRPDEGGGCELHFVHDGVGESDGDDAAAAWRARLGLDGQRETPMADAFAILDATRTVLLVSYIGPEVPTTLADAGFDVVVRSGP